MAQKDLENILKAIASAPAHCDVKNQRDKAIWLKREKSLQGLQILFESCPDVIEQSPLFHGRVYSETSTSARVVYEFGLNGTIGAAAASLGYFSDVYGDYHGLGNTKLGPLKSQPGRLKDTISHLINRSSSIGSCLFAIGSEEINLWPRETAIMRIEEDISSLLLHVKFTLSPFCSILIIPTGDASWLTRKINIKRASAEAGLDCLGVDRFGRIRLQWNPPVPKVQPTPLWKLPSLDEIEKHESRLSFSQLLKNTQEKYNQKIMLESSRLEIAKKQNSAASKKGSQASQSSQSLSQNGNTSGPSLQKTPISGLEYYQETWFADSELE